MITGVLTSCCRHDLLEQTLASLYATDGGQLDKLIVVEDGRDIPEALRARFAGRAIEWISTGQRVGQVAAIDYAYSRVNTPYVFHLEDDWLFFRNGFLLRSMEVLRGQPKCLQVWIRPLDDMQGHPLQPHEFRTGAVEWRRLSFGYLDVWHGFSWNPGLRRLADYVSIGGFGIHARFDAARPLAAEVAIGRVYRQRDFWSAALSDSKGIGYVRHIGGGRHVTAEHAS